MTPYIGVTNFDNHSVLGPLVLLLFVEIKTIFICHICRSELDHVCSPDCGTEEFSVTLDLIMSPKDRLSSAASFPWQGYSGKGVSPKLLFMKKEELLAVTTEFGK